MDFKDERKFPGILILENGQNERNISKSVIFDHFLSKVSIFYTVSLRTGDGRKLDQTSRPGIG